MGSAWRSGLMGKAGAHVRETLDLPGRSASEVGELVIGEFRRHPEYTVAATGTGAHQLVRTTKRLGVLRSTEVATIVVVDGARGATITVSGRLLAATWELAKAAASSHCDRPSAPPPPPAHAPAPVAAPAPITVPSRSVEPSGETVARPARTSALTALALRLPDGRSIPVDSDVLLGRDPSSGPTGSGPARLIALDDPDRQISKTHLVVRVARGGVEVEDLHSTNGTSLLGPGGTAAPLTPRVAIVAPIGSRVRLGGIDIEVVAVG